MDDKTKDQKQAEKEAEIKKQQEQLQDARIAAVMTELAHALQTLLETGETYTIYLGSTGLTEPEQVGLLQELGEGELKLELTNHDEPVSWYETLFPGIWVGTFRNQRGEAKLRTVEVSFFPEVAASQRFDVESSIQQLTAQATLKAQHE